MTEFPLPVDGVRAPDASALYALLKWAETHQPELVAHLRRHLGESAEMLEHPIEELDLGVRAWSALKREKPDMKIGDLIAMTEDDLRDVRGLRDSRIKEIKARLARLGLSLKQKRGIAPA